MSEEKGGGKGGGGGLQVSAAPEEIPGLPESFKLLVFDGFDGLNTKPTRPAIEDQQCYILDGWMPLGVNNARTLPDIGTAIYTNTNNIAYFTFGNINNTAVCIVFLKDGSIVQVNTTTMATTTIAPAGTITTPSNPIGVAGWGSQYILICAPQPNGYFIWDGTAFYGAGTLGPGVDITDSGFGYTGNPTIVATGGAGTGATFTSTVTSSGNISQIFVATPGSGYRASDAVVLSFSGGGGPTTAIAATSVVGGRVTNVSITNAGSGYTSATKATFLGGGGTGATATVTASGGVSAVTITVGGEGYIFPPTVQFSDTNNAVAQATVPLMPYGVQGSALETFTSRAWVVNGGATMTTPPLSLVQFTAPSSPQDFNVSDGGGQFLSTDSFLRVGFHSVRQSNGFLYMIGDSSVNYVSGVSTSGTPPTTTFSNQNVDPQVGCPWPNTVQVYSRAIVFANTFGVHAMYGGAVQKVSTPLDGIYTSVTPTGSIPSYGTIVPSAAVAIIFGIHVYILLLPIIDQVTGLQTNKLLMWDGKKWWTADQSVTLTQIASQEINSVLTAYGTDGSAIYPLFQTPSTAITKTIQSKFWDSPSYITTKRPLELFGIVSETTADVANLNVTIESENTSQTLNFSNLIAATWTNNLGQTATWLNNASLPATWQASGLAAFQPARINAVSGALIGLTASTTSKDMTLISLSIVEQQYDFRL